MSRNKWLAILAGAALLSLFYRNLVFADVADDMRRYCASRGMNTESSGGTIYCVPRPGQSPSQSGPSREQLEDQRRQQAEMAAHDANDEGAACYNRGDWACAIANFEAALEYGPDDPVILENLQKAKARQAAVARSTRPAPVPSQPISTPPPATSPEVARIMQGIRAIQVPPPIPPDEVMIRLGEVAPRHTSEVVAEVFLELGGAAVPPMQLVIIPMQITLAAADAADLYLVRQTATYERALQYLRDPATRQQFTALMRAIKENRPLPENASIEMARAAQLIVNVGDGNSTSRIFWNAMMSPDAVNAALTRGFIEAAGYLGGLASARLFQRVQAVREPAYQAGMRGLERLEGQKARVVTAGDQRVLDAAIGEANGLINSAYHLHETAARGLEPIVSFFIKYSESERRERR